MTGAKECRWEALNPHGEWVPGLLGARESELPLYRESDVVMGIAAGETALLVESESSVDALRGWYATTWAGGAGSPAVDTIRRVLAEHARVVIVGDNDDAGRACAEKLARALPLARVLFSDVDGEDARDLYARVGAEEFAALVTAALDEHDEPPEEDDPTEEDVTDDPLADLSWLHPSLAPPPPPSCPLPRCTRPSRDERRGGLCEPHYESPMVGHSVGRNLSPRDIYPRRNR